MTPKSIKRLLPERTQRMFTGYRLVLAIVATLVLTAGMTYVLVRFKTPLEPLGAWGYPGIFVIMLLNSLTILFPAFGQAFLIAAAQNLNPWLLGIVGGIGGTFGELSSYFVGRAGGRLLIGRRLYDTYREKPGVRGNFFGPILLVFAATPLPVDVVGIIAGAVHYPISKFLAWVGVGKIISTTAIAFAGYFAIGWLQRIFNPTG